MSVNRTVRARRLEAVARGDPISFLVNGCLVQAYAGESIAAALLANGWRVFRNAGSSNSPRGLFCGMGICFDCLVTVDGVPNVRACMTMVREGCVVQLGEAT